MIFLTLLVLNYCIFKPSKASRLLTELRIVDICGLIYAALRNQHPNWHFSHVACQLTSSFSAEIELEFSAFLKYPDLLPCSNGFWEDRFQLQAIEVVIG